MHDHPGRLVDNENVGVLEDNGERDILAEYLTADGRGDVDRDSLPFPGTITRPFAPSLHRHVSAGDQRGGLIARQIELRGNRDVEAGGVGGGDEFVVHGICHPEELSDEGCGKLGKLGSDPNYGELNWGLTPIVK